MTTSAGEEEEEEAGKPEATSKPAEEATDILQRRRRRIYFNTLNFCRAIIPAANGHCSARALARYYATLITGGVIPPPHTSLSKPLLGSHIHIPELPSRKTDKKKRSNKDSKKGILQDNNDSVRYRLLDNNVIDETMSNTTGIFQNPRIHDAFMGMGDHRNLVTPDGNFGLGFRRFKSATGQVTSFGHSGAGGSTGFCDIEHNFAIAVTLNKMSLGGATSRIIQLVCSELNVPLPEEFSSTGEKGPDMTLQIN